MLLETRIHHALPRLETALSALKPSLVKSEPSDEDPASPQAVLQHAIVPKQDAMSGLLGLCAVMAGDLNPQVGSQVSAKKFI